MPPAARPVILDHVLALPRGLDPAASLVGATRAAADAFSAELAAAGFSEGSARSHPGRGTANRRLFLDDLMLECLLVDDEAALDDPRGAALGLGKRFRESGASGLGIAFRPDPDAPGDLPSPDFPSVAYRPAYLPEDLHVDVARDATPGAPLLFHLPFARRAGAPGDGEPRGHANGARRVRSVGLEAPTAPPAATLEILEAAGVRCAPGPIECLHVGLDGVPEAFELDLRPRFGLRLHA